MTSRKAYIYGMIFGDASLWMDKSTGAGKLGLECVDREMADALLNAIKEEYGYKGRTEVRSTKRSTFKFTITNKMIYSDLAVFDRSDNLWVVPDMIFQSDEPCRCAFLRALYDSDGSASIRSGQAYIWKNSYRGLEGVQKLLEGIGVEGTAVARRGENSSRPKACFITIPRRSLPVFIEKVGCTIPRKLETLVAAARYAKEKTVEGDLTLMRVDFAEDNPLNREWIDARHDQGFHHLVPCEFMLDVFLSGKKVGAMAWGRPRHASSEEKTLELKRMVLIDETPMNAESRTLSLARACIRRSKPDVKLVVSYCDTSYGHDGASYRADGWCVVGKHGAVMKFARTP